MTCPQEDAPPSVEGLLSQSLRRAQAFCTALQHHLYSSPPPRSTCSQCAGRPPSSGPKAFRLLDRVQLRTPPLMSGRVIMLLDALASGTPMRLYGLGLAHACARRAGSHAVLFQRRQGHRTQSCHAAAPALQSDFQRLSSM